jgi:hypothetical protein
MTAKIDFRPESATPGAANYPDNVLVHNTNFSGRVLKFDKSTEDECFFGFKPLNYTSGDFTVDIDWLADSGSSGTVVFEAQLLAVTPNTDNVDLTAESFAAANSVTDTHLGTTAKRHHRATITVNNLDSIAADDFAVLKLKIRNTGTMAGLCNVTNVTLSYADA